MIVVNLLEADATRFCWLSQSQKRLVHDLNLFLLAIADVLDRLVHQQVCGSTDSSCLVSITNLDESKRNRKVCEIGVKLDGRERACLHCSTNSKSAEFQVGKTWNEAIVHDWKQAVIYERK